MSEVPASLKFGRFRILPHRREVLADGRPIELGGRAFDVLMALIEANGEVVSKDGLISRAWPGRIIEEGNLRALIRAPRAALGDPDLIRTVAGRGYQFTGVVLKSSGRGQVPMNRGVTDAAIIAAPRLSIVVLPFISLSDDREQQYFAFGENMVRIIRIPKMTLAGGALSDVEPVSPRCHWPTGKGPFAPFDRVSECLSVWLHSHEDLGNGASGNAAD